MYKRQLVDGIAAAFKALRPGHTWSGDTTLSPIISRKDALRIDGVVRRAVAAGANIAAGGGLAAVEGEGGYYQPTILTGVGSDMEAVRDEIFGPVMTVQVFDDDDEALALGDHPAYGLAAGVHTADIGRALRCARELEAGTVWINRYGRSDDYVLPTGGFKRSGMGKDLGRQSYEANLRYKTVLVDFMRQ